MMFSSFLLKVRTILICPHERGQWERSRKDDVLLSSSSTFSFFGLSSKADIFVHLTFSDPAVFCSQWSLGLQTERIQLLNSWRRQNMKKNYEAFEKQWDVSFSGLLNQTREIMKWKRKTKTHHLLLGNKPIQWVLAMVCDLAWISASVVVVVGGMCKVHSF